MQENFEGYKAELDRIRLTAESRKALAESLSRRGSAERSKPRRLTAGARRISAIAAVVCLLSALSVAAVAQVAGNPTLGNAFTGDQEGYDQSSGFIGRSVENDGWTVTITDCVGDDFQAYLGVEVTAPEGTVLDAEYYEMCVDNEYDREYSGSSKGLLYSLPDDDPTDNKIRLTYGWYTSNGVSNHLNMKLKLVDLTENHGYLWDEWKWDRRLVKEGVWDFGWISVDYADNAIRLSPMVEIPESGGLVLSEVVISPVGLYIHFCGPEPYRTDWVDNWYKPNVGSTIRLLDVDGNEIPLYMGGFFGPCGTHFLYTDHENAMNSATGSGPARLNLVDPERVGSLSVAGITIPVQ